MNKLQYTIELKVLLVSRVLENCDSDLIIIMYRIIHAKL